MNVDFVRDRITQLRLQKGVSEYKMSYDLGHSRGYINNISSGKTLPSMTEFFAICDYFEITALEFFQDGKHDPHALRIVSEEMSVLSPEDLGLVQALVLRLARK